MKINNFIKETVKSYLTYKSFKTNRRLILFESDDWGSIRVRDKETRDKLNKINIQVKEDRFCQYDSIASEEDLTALFEVLNSIKDINGNPACLTANVCTANPDFEAIKDSKYERFFYQSFTHTLNEYSSSKNLFMVWEEGIKNKLFAPQLHGREHLHALAWLKELRSGNQELLKAFELGAWGIPYNTVFERKGRNLQAALQVHNLISEKEYHQQWIKDSALLFRNSFGYTATSFIAPNYTWHSNLNRQLSNCGIKTLQGIKVQFHPSSPLSFSRKIHYTGEKDYKKELSYTVRNVIFEPTKNEHQDWANTALNEIKFAFDNNTPAIVCCHRLNFVGRLNTLQRDNNLYMLKKLLHEVVKVYPDVEFISSSELASLLHNNNT